MLRALVIGCAVVALAGLTVVMVTTGAPLWGPALMVGLALALMLFERVRYKPLDGDAPAAPWRATDERFVDPETGAMVRVWFNPATGERRYVVED